MLLIICMSFYTVSARRQGFVSKLTREEGFHCFPVHRSCLYSDVLHLFQQDVLNYYPLSVRFVNKQAVNCGGVCQDKISGGSLYIPFWWQHSWYTSLLHAQTNMQDFSILGMILSHGYLLEGYLPVRVAFPSLVAMYWAKLKSLKIFLSLPSLTA